MSSVPSSSAKFSLMDVKAKMMKKKEKPEKSEEAVLPNPVHVVATRSKGSSKKRKALDSVTDLESFEGLTAAEVKEKMHTHYSMLHLGYERILELMKDQEVELRDLKETCANLKGMLAERQKLEETHAKEIEELQAKPEEEKKKVVDEAQDSAVNAVYESMYEMAKEAAEHGFTLPHWDYQGWGESIGKKTKVKVADPQDTQVAPDAEGTSGGVDGGNKKVTDDDNKDAQA